jgi:hypothetical protein
MKKEEKKLSQAFLASAKGGVVNSEAEMWQKLEEKGGVALPVVIKGERGEQYYALETQRDGFLIVSSPRLFFRAARKFFADRPGLKKFVAVFSLPNRTTA